MEVDNIEIRLAIESDIKGLIDLWKNHSEWGEVTEVKYHKWFVNQPYGQAVKIVAQAKDGEIIGQIVFNPVKVKVKDLILNAVKIAAPIVKPLLKNVSLLSSDHLILQMYDFGLQYCKDHGYSFAFATPAKGWLSVIKFIGRAKWKDYFNHIYSCFLLDWNHSIPIRFTDHWNDYTVSTIKVFDQSFNELWANGSADFPIECGIVRDAKWLSWKIGGHLVLGIYKNEQPDKLFGYLALNQKTGLVVDSFAANEFDLGMTLYKGLDYIKNHFQNQDQHLLKQFYLINNFVYKNILPPNTKLADNLDFAFSCTVLQDSLLKKNIHPSKWFLMPND